MLIFYVHCSNSFQCNPEVATHEDKKCCNRDVLGLLESSVRFWNETKYKFL